MEGMPPSAQPTGTKLIPIGTKRSKLTVDSAYLTSVFGAQDQNLDLF